MFTFSPIINEEAFMEKSVWKNSKCVWFGMGIFLMMLTLWPAVSQAFEIEIDVSPKVLNLSSNGQVVTVHTNIEYALVDVSSLYLDGVPISSWKSDDRGYFVAKFMMDDIKSLPLNIGEANIVKLVGLTTNGLAFWGEEAIQVILNLPKGK